jgi:hypothetical protein
MKPEKAGLMQVVSTELEVRPSERAERVGKDMQREARI